ncbi:MAG: phenylacetate--CoA ligase [Spirochaetota bacterium]|nr:MAG: phenylacetate--CoA ligase [Spirochaetota bacterium]
MIWNNESETLTDRKKQSLQGELLKNLVNRMYKSIPFYRKKLGAVGMKPGDVSQVEDITKLPFTTKDDLRDNYPFGMFAVSMEDVVEIHTSSGTTGKPIIGGYTKGDIDVWSEVMARCLSASGTTQNDVVQNAYGYGLFTGGLGVHYGARRIGATVIPISGGNTKRQVMILQDFNSSILTCTPSYSLYLAEVGEQIGVDFSKLPLKAGNFGAEPWSNNMRKEIERKLGLLALDIYGLTEIIGPGVGNECEYKCGIHICDDHFYPEIIDPETTRVLPHGEIGELVITTLTREATPLLRYRTRDITKLIPGKCQCGRTSMRMERIMGRTDDMLIIRGVNVFPSQIEEVLVNIEGVEPHYQIVINRVGTLDELEVHVEMNERLISDEIKVLETVERKIQSDIESVLGIKVDVKLVEPKTLIRSEGKAKRVIDKRQL